MRHWSKAAEISWLSSMMTPSHIQIGSTEAERRAFLEICDERYLTRSTLLTSQLPVAKWHAQIGDPTVADSILDRLVHGAHRIELQGDSIRKLKGRNGKKGE